MPVAPSAANSSTLASTYTLQPVAGLTRFPAAAGRFLAIVNTLG